MRTVLIVDDDKDLRYMLKYLIETTSDFEVVGDAGNGEEAIAVVGQINPDVVVMDVQMPVMDGVAATKRIKELYPSVHIVGLTAFGQYPELMLGAGASKCLLKNESYTSLVPTLNRLKEEAETGEAWI
jgi:YesN/AraC family two-component response regulator